MNGITLGYLAHAVLAAIGLATLIAASPTLFEVVRWVGIAYLSWIAFGMVRSAVSPSAEVSVAVGRVPVLSLWRGFLTSFLNPKGLFVYLAFVPQFIDPSLGSATAQAFALSVTNAVLCYFVYAAVGLLAARSRSIGANTNLRTRIAEGIGGTLLGGVAVKLAAE